MEKKWTPGPWHAIKNPTFDGAKYRVCSNPDEPWDNYGEICYARKSNAHLIAAAPELYEALFNMMEIYYGRAEQSYPGQMAKDAMNALAKARGETGERGE